MVIIRPITVPTTGIRFQDATVEAYHEDKVLGKGSLFVTEDAIMWVKENGNDGFTIQYKKMTLHAISRDPNMHPRGCLYLMVNGSLDDELNGEVAQPSIDEEMTELRLAPEGESQSGLDDMLYKAIQDFSLLPPGATSEDSEVVQQPSPSPNDEEEMTELRFVPDDEARLDDMYKAIQECTLLHPDASSDMSECESDASEEEERVSVARAPAPPGPSSSSSMEPLLYGMGSGRLIYQNNYVLSEHGGPFGPVRQMIADRFRMQQEGVPMKMDD